MVYFLKSWNKTKEVLKRRDIFLFLDFDGTLAPIAPTPQDVQFPEEARGLLKRLVGLLDGRVAVVSGRALKDLRDRVKLNGLYYIGNHGFEIQGPGLNFEKHYSVSTKRLFKAIKAQLQEWLSSVPGLLIEDKKITISVHYRLVEERHLETIKTIFETICHPYHEQKMINLFYGKKVLEIRPPIYWNKGTAVAWLLEKLCVNGILPIYLGDDKTDEDAFIKLKNKGITIFVADKKRKASQARYYLNSPKEVSEFLKQLVRIKGN